MEQHGRLSEGYQPQRPDWTIDQGWTSYSAAEHAVWATLMRRQLKLLPGRVCDAFEQGLRALPLDPQRIPDFRRLSERLRPRTGWEVVAVPGLLPDPVFFDHLAHRRFPAGNFIRRADQLDYLQEPDVFHDVFGHVPLLLHRPIADFIQAYGIAALQAHDRGQLEPLARLYWYTIEFGLVREPGGLRIYGAGIASSPGECRWSLQSRRPQRLRFDPLRVMRTHYLIDDFQQLYFVLDRLDDLLELSAQDWTPWLAQVQTLAPLQPGQQIDTDQPMALDARTR